LLFSLTVPYFLEQGGDPLCKRYHQSLHPPGASSSLFSGRNNGGVTVGNYWDAKGNQHAFMLKGTTLTPIVHPKA
jgi:hypothetical protein